MVCRVVGLPGLVVVAPPRAGGAEHGVAGLAEQQLLE